MSYEDDRIRTLEAEVAALRAANADLRKQLEEEQAHAYELAQQLETRSMERLQ